MGWLAGSWLASMVVAFLAVRIFDYIFSGVTGSLVAPARASLFVATWTAVGAKSGMHGFTKRVRQLRRGNAKARSRIWP